MLGTSDEARTTSVERGNCPKSVGRLAAMCDAARGEPIARKRARLNGRERTGAETLEGLSHPERTFSRGATDGAKWKSSDTLRCTRAGAFGLPAGQARERSPGEIPVQASAGKP